MAETRDPKPAVGISNRESPQQESEERAKHPPLNRITPDAQSSTASAGEDAQTSGKSGSRSTAQKESESKYSDRGMPATSKTDGAFGRERGD